MTRLPRQSCKRLIYRVNYLKNWAVSLVLLTPREIPDLLLQEPTTGDMPHLPEV